MPLRWLPLQGLMTSTAQPAQLVKGVQVDDRISEASGTPDSLNTRVLTMVWITATDEIHPIVTRTWLHKLVCLEALQRLPR